MNSDVDDFISVDGGDDDGIDGWYDLQQYLTNGAQKVPNTYSR
jgi:hypothetical protein